jgi:ATP-binding cassette subfamily B protein
MMVWRTSRGLTAASLVLRLVRAVLPVITLYLGKLIIDEVVLLVQAPHKPETLRLWLGSGLLNWLIILLLSEFALAVMADVLGRVVSLIDSLLAERVTNASSVRLMEHAAKLDLEDFEDSEFQDQLERARRQTSGRMTLMGQLFSQAQDVVTVASFAAGLIFYAPWLIALLFLALVPAFIGEAHFNAQSYSLDFVRTPERRELDYVRQTAASVESIHPSCDRLLRSKSSACVAARWLGRTFHRDRNRGVLSGLCLHNMEHTDGKVLRRRSNIPCRLVPALAQPS